MLALGAGSNSWQQSFNFPLKDALLGGGRGKVGIIAVAAHPYFPFGPEGGALSSTGQAVPGPGYHSPAVNGINRSCVTEDCLISQKGGRGRGLGLSCKVTLSESDRGLLCRQRTYPRL